jgi:MFS family permease
MAWSDCLLSPVNCAAEKAGGAAANSAWESFLTWSAQGLSDLAATVFHEFSTSTAPRFDQSWWRENLDLMAMVSLPILVAAFVAQCITAVVRREPGQLSRALVGALVGTAGVPIAVGAIAGCGRAADEISLAIIGDHVTADGYKRMTDISAVLAVGTAGGYVLMAVLLGLIALFALYFVMLLREVALLAFVVFAPLALIGWTWAPTRHWLRRWIEVVAALLFSKIAMATVFTLGVAATGAAGQGGGSNLGTFLAGILLIAMAAFTPMVTFSFIHWAGDQSYAAMYAMQHGSSGVSGAREQLDSARRWTADHFGAKQDTGHDVVGDQQDPTSNAAPIPANATETTGTHSEHDQGGDRPSGHGGRSASASSTDNTHGGGAQGFHTGSDTGSDRGHDSGPGREAEGVPDGQQGGGASVAIATATANATSSGNTENAGDVGGRTPLPPATSPTMPSGQHDVPGPTHTREP